MAHGIRMMFETDIFRDMFCRTVCSLLSLIKCTHFSRRGETSESKRERGRKWKKGEKGSDRCSGSIAISLRTNACMHRPKRVRIKKRRQNSWLRIQGREKCPNPGSDLFATDSLIAAAATQVVGQDVKSGRREEEKSPHKTSPLHSSLCPFPYSLLLLLSLVVSFRLSLYVFVRCSSHLYWNWDYKSNYIKLPGMKSDDEESHDETATEEEGEKANRSTVLLKWYSNQNFSFFASPHCYVHCLSLFSLEKSGQGSICPISLSTLRSLL